MPSKPKINDQQIFQTASTLLQQIYGQDAAFRDGQYEAIEAILTNKRTLVVQKTGWGKSLVYFVAAKMLAGVTIIISPLLVLMDNQRDAATKMGLRCAVLNSTVKNEARTALILDIINNQYDLIFTTPETLYKEDVQKLLPHLKISLFVIDECHCISDWGHDFRLEYSKLNRVIAALPANVAVLGTTATANDRVIADLTKQFNGQVYVSRGPLTRDSLHLQILRLETRAERYAWILENINKLPGSGIIYCLTHRDCQNLADFLCQNNINARAYYSDSKLDTPNADGLSSNATTELMFLHDEIKVVVATIKLGMGYDKPNIGFVIHYQRPMSLIAYYQQIGRAGRADGMDAYCFLMVGQEDNAIANYFIENAFPTAEQESILIKALEDESAGLKLTDLLKKCNITRKALLQTINMLQHNDMIYSENGRYYRSINPYHYPQEHYESIKKAKALEVAAVDALVNEQGCLSRFIVEQLNDINPYNCGKCANCTGHDIINNLELGTKEEIVAIQEDLNTKYITIEPRKIWPFVCEFDKNTRIAEQNELGLALARFGESGYGAWVRADYENAPIFREELVQSLVAMVQENLREAQIALVTNVPSLNQTKVDDLANRVARSLNLPYMPLLMRNPSATTRQKAMQNSPYQCANALKAFQFKFPVTIEGSLLLIDDFVDSRWTLTVCGRILRSKGANKVFPICLADYSLQQE